jgi:hypothetical protein
MSFDLERAIRVLERRDSLRFAEECGAWAIRRSKLRRIRGVSELEETHKDALSCFHGVSYTLACARCKRSTSEAKINLDRIKAKLSIT